MFTTCTIIISVLLVLSALVSTSLNPFFRILFGKGSLAKCSEENADADKPLSIIVMTNEDIPLQENTLTALHEQDYSAGFQLIIVAEEGDSDMEDLLKRHADNPIIKSTFIPKTTRYISREKLGITLGVKAASYEWCILINGNCTPKSRNWLTEIGKACQEDKNIVIGYCNYDRGSKVFQRFRRLRDYAYIMDESRSGRTYSASTSNLAFRKSEFIQGDGFRGHLDCTHGACDFIVNKYSRKNGTAIVKHPDSWLIEKAPSRKQWNIWRLSQIHADKFMTHGLRHKLWSFMDSLTLHLSWIFSLSASAFAIIESNWFVLSSAILSIIILITGRILVDRKAFQYFDSKIPAWLILPLELASVWRTLADNIRYRRANKYDFTCHKL